MKPKSQTMYPTAVEWVLLGREFAISTTWCLPKDGLDKPTFFSIGEVKPIRQDPSPETKVGYLYLSLPAMNMGWTRPMAMVAIVVPRVSSTMAIIAALTRSPDNHGACAHTINLWVGSMKARVRKT